jgi:hypothetical protein
MEYSSEKMAGQTCDRKAALRTSVKSTLGKKKSEAELQRELQYPDLRWHLH